MTGFHSKRALAKGRTFRISTSLPSGRHNAGLRPKPRCRII